MNFDKKTLISQNNRIFHVLFQYMYVLDLIEMHGNFIKFLDCIMTENYFVC